MASKRELFAFIQLSSLFSMIAKSDAYDYFWHVQRWPPSVCSGNVTGSCRQGLGMFVIYGFWPENNVGKCPSYCNSSPYDPNEIESIRDELDVYRPLVYEGSNEKAWKFAWEVHGSCSETQFNQRQYFEAAIKIRTELKYDLRLILRRAGITPGRRLLQRSDKTAIYQKLEKLPGIRCNVNKNSGKAQFSGVVLCVEHDGITLRNCSPSANQNCPSFLIWPAAETSKLGFVSNL